ncbi:MAG: hypothetical protein IKJ07_04285 [Clostridia bacterium]|nr:hypothetical protein [Clostridia bacterium]
MKKVLLCLIIFLVCISLFRLSFGVNEEIVSKDILTFISEVDNTTEAFKGVFVTYKQFADSIDSVFSNLNLTATTPDVGGGENSGGGGRGDWMESDNILDTVKIFFDWVSYIFQTLLAVLIFTAALLVNIFPLLRALLMDLLTFVKIVYYLLFAVPM